MHGTAWLPLRRVAGRVAPYSNPDFAACSESAPRALWRRSAKEAARLDRVSEEGPFARRSVTAREWRAAPFGQSGCQIGAADVGVVLRQGNRGSVAAGVPSFTIFELNDRGGRMMLSSVARPAKGSAPIKVIAVALKASMVYIPRLCALA